TGTTYYYCIVTNTIVDNLDGGTKTATATSKIAKITVNAQVDTYTITFNANGGSVSSVSAETNGGKLATLPTPTKSGYRFDGWFTEASGGTPVTTSTVFAANATIYAHWAPIDYDYDYTPPMKPVIVDGKTQNIGSEKTNGGTTVINVDQPKLTEQLGKANDESSVVVPVSANATATVSLMLKNVEDMAKKNMTLSVKTGGITYDLPTASVGVAALAAAFPGQDTAKIPFEVTIKASDVKIDGATVIVTPVSFTVSAVYGGESMTVDRFSAFVERTFEITKAQSEIISTAVVVESDGTLRHVPTFVFEKDGKYYATVKSMTNSVYALIQNEVTFADAVGKWYEDIANEVGSRRIVIGTDKGTFSGDAKITRAEYATMMVRALGLPLSKSDSFTDVAANAWYAGYVATA
ncbi:MAG: InlB B-repeat-containing protein, partial [Oscillospiraceae bacterium]